jgi:hypothetical protein
VATAPWWPPAATNARTSANLYATPEVVGDDAKSRVVVGNPLRLVAQTGAALLREGVKAHSARSLHDMMAASDPARRLLERKMAEKAHSARSLQEMMDAADPGKPE